MKIMAALALACGFITAPMMAAGTASGSPTCDAAACVPYVARDASQGGPCLIHTRYVFGLDSSGGTLVCTAVDKWGQWVPLIGVRNLGAPCYGSSGAAQSPDGLPMACIGLGWTADYNEIYDVPAA